jgi:hypothetical protein
MMHKQNNMRTHTHTHSLSLCLSLSHRFSRGGRHAVVAIGGWLLGDARAGCSRATLVSQTVAGLLCAIGLCLLLVPRSLCRPVAGGCLV